MSAREQSVADWLESGRAFGSTGSVRRIDTHAASVFLAGDRAWKLKRPVRFDYLDFTTPDKRRDALKAELALNRVTAPMLYIAVHPITLAPDGTLAIDGAGDTVDWLLEMRRFPDDALLSDMADRGAIGDELVRDLADRIRAVHLAADAAPIEGGAARLRAVIAGCAVSLVAWPAILDAAAADRLVRRLNAATDANGALLDARGQAGRIAHVHGDLHLANIALVDGVPTLFDRLEFDASLATTDVLYDLAFLAMDLWARGLRRQANLLVNRYFDLSPDDDEAAFVLLPLFMALRAAIRSHVIAAQSVSAANPAEAISRAQRYLALAADLLEEAPARLVAIGGLSGTGKSTLARQIGWMLGRPPGARILRSDAIRKRLAGVAPESRLTPERYTAAASTAVYEALNRLAAQAARGGWAAIADAMFVRSTERDDIERVAAAAGCRFDGLWLDLQDEQRIARVTARTGDASDADAAIAAAQTRLTRAVPAGWTRLDAAGDIAALSIRAASALKIDKSPGSKDLSGAP